MPIYAVITQYVEAPGPQAALTEVPGAIAVREVTLPYPWCHGNPTRLECAAAGYCRREVSCGD